MAATATFKASLDIQPALNAQGLQTGLDLTQPSSTINLALTVTAWRGFKFPLPGAFASQVLAFADISAASFLLVTANKPVIITVTTTTLNANTLVNQFLFIANSSANPITACTIQDTGTGGSLVEVMLAG